MIFFSPFQCYLEGFGYSLLLLSIFQKFLLGGRLIFGPDVASLFLSTFLIAGPSFAFCLKILIIIRDKLRENTNALPWYPVLVVAIVLTILVSKLPTVRFFFILLLLFIFFSNTNLDSQFHTT